MVYCGSNEGYDFREQRSKIEYIENVLLGDFDCFDCFGEFYLLCVTFELHVFNKANSWS